MEVFTEISESISQTIEPVLINESAQGHTFLASSKGQEIIDFDPHDVLLEYLDDKSKSELFTMLKENKCTSYNVDDEENEDVVHGEEDQDVQEVVDGLKQLPNYHQLTYNIKFTDLTYNLENLEFNLQPNRGCLYGDNLREIVNNFSTNSQDIDFIEKLIDILDTPCERQSDCAFLQYFYPHIEKPGNICYSVGAESLLTCVPQAIVSEIDYITWLSVLQNTFFPEIYENEFAPRTQDLNICICCLILQQAKIPIETQSDSCLLIREDSSNDVKNRIVHFINGEGESSMQYDTFADFFNITGHTVYKIEFPFKKYIIENGVVQKVA